MSVTGAAVTPIGLVQGQPASVTLSGHPACAAVLVDFGDGVIVVQELPAGLPYAFTHGWPTVGGFTVRALGLGSCSGEVTTSVTIATNAPPSVTLTAPSAGTIAAGTPVTFSATASDPQGISAVEFYANDWLLATDTTAPYSYTRSDLPGGSWTLRAQAYDGYGVAAWSAPVYVTVQAPEAHGPSALDAPPLSVPITVTVDVSGSGSVTSVPGGLTCAGSDITCTGTFTAGAELDLTATPDTGMTFVGWAGACRGTTPVCTITPGSDVLVVARFAPPPPPIALTYYHTDVLGSVRAITDVTGATVARHDYFAFGESTSSMAGDPRRFTGKERDAETALDYFGARYYRNVLGRFTAVDPALWPEDARVSPQRWNRYAYASNNPTRFKDSNGADIQVLDDMALDFIRATLPEELRASVQLDGRRMIDVNLLKKLKTSNSNFMALLALAQSNQLVSVSTAESIQAEGKTFEFT